MVKTLTLKDGTKVALDTTHDWKNLKVIEMEMPEDIDGVACKWGRDSGEYRIFLNSGIDERQKLKAFIHEMIHLYRGDHDKENESVQKIESECHQLTQEVIEALKSNIEDL